MSSRIVKVLVAGGSLGLLAVLFIERPSAQLTVSPTVLDFGLSEPFELASGRIEIFNHGSEESQVTVTSDCSCVDVSLPLFSLGPESRASVVIDMRRTGGGSLRGGIRHIDRKLLVRSNTFGVVETCIVSLAAQFKEPFIVDPATLSLRTSRLTTKEFTFTLAGSVPLRPTIEDLSGIPGIASIAWDSNLNKGIVRIALNNQDLLSHSQGSCRMKLDGISSYDRVNIPLRISVEPSVVFNPPIAVFDGTSEIELLATPHPDLPEGCTVALESITGQPHYVNAEIVANSKCVFYLLGDANNGPQATASVNVRLTLNGLLYKETVKIPIYFF